MKNNPTLLNFLSTLLLTPHSMSPKERDELITFFARDYHLAGFVMKYSSTKFIDERLDKSQINFRIESSWSLTKKIREQDFPPELIDAMKVVCNAVNNRPRHTNEYYIADTFLQTLLGWKVPVEIDDDTKYDTRKILKDEDVLGYYDYGNDINTNNSNKGYYDDYEPLIVLYTRAIREYRVVLASNAKTNIRNYFWQEYGKQDGVSANERNKKAEKLIKKIFDILKHSSAGYTFNILNCDTKTASVDPAIDAHIAELINHEIDKYITDRDIYAYVLAHELFHALQDFHVGLLYCKSNNINKHEKGYIETLAEFFSLSFVSLVLKNNILFSCLVSSRAKERTININNDYTAALEEFGDICNFDYNSTDIIRTFLKEYAFWENSLIQNYN